MEAFVIDFNLKDPVHQPAVVLLEGGKVLAAVRTESNRVMMSTYNFCQGNRGVKIVIVGLNGAELVMEPLSLLLAGLESIVGLLPNNPFCIYRKSNEYVRSQWP